MRDVIVTGGTGALGSAVVDAFLAAGDRVVVPWIVEAEFEQARSARAEAVEAGHLVLLACDIAEQRGAAELAKAAGEPAVLINGVGGFAGGDPVDATDLDVWDRLYRMNVRTAVACTRAVLPGMRKRGSGVIINVSSQATRSCPAGLAAYSASKAAVSVLTETTQAEVAADGIRVCAVVPSTIDTPANRSAMPDADFSGWTPPERIATVMAWLASDAASTVRGALLPV